MPPYGPAYLHLSLGFDYHIDESDESPSGGQIKRRLAALLLVLQAGPGDDENFGDQRQTRLDGDV